MKNKTKYNLFITLLVFIGLIISVGLFVSFGLLVNVYFPEGLGDMPFLPQFLIFTAVYFLIFPTVMVLISNVYLRASGKKTWGNWLKIPLNYTQFLRSSPFINARFWLLRYWYHLILLFYPVKRSTLL